MKKNLIVFILLCTVAFRLHAQTADAEMKAWQAYMTPGDIHKMLSKSDGNWTFESSTWMSPAAPPEKGTGTAVYKMILGGRYQSANFSGNMMGMPFEGQNLTGYDNMRKVFQSSWVDNMGTGVMQMEGKLDAATKTINFSGKMTDPVSGKDIMVREKFIFVDDNTQKMEMYDTRDGKETKSMEIIFKRKV
ncbi:MAG: DUF1579 domain-containing protein [Chitinophagaceae bacterium]